MWPNPQETADLVAFTKGILNEKLHFFVQCEVSTTQRPLIPTSDLPKKRSKPNPKSTKQISILEEKFLICN